MIRLVKPLFLILVASTLCAAESTIDQVSISVKKPGQVIHNKLAFPTKEVDWDELLQSTGISKEEFLLNKVQFMDYVTAASSDSEGLVPGEFDFDEIEFIDLGIDSNQEPRD